MFYRYSLYKILHYQAWDTFHRGGEGGDIAYGSMEVCRYAILEIYNCMRLLLVASEIIIIIIHK